MAKQRNIAASSQAFEKLIKRRGKRVSEYIDHDKLKSLQRARKGEPLNPDTFQYFAGVFEVEIPDLQSKNGKHSNYERNVSVRLSRTESLAGFPKGYFDITDFDVMVPLVVDARLDLADPQEEQTEIIAQLIEMIEALIGHQKPSKRIRTLGKINSTIQQLSAEGIQLFAGRYDYRKGVWPWMDADQTIIACTVVENRLLLVFAEALASKSISRQIDQGISLAQLNEDEDWINAQIQDSKNNKLDDIAARYYGKLIQQGKEFLPDNEI